jgi:LacI family transcriptional regulator
MGFDDNVVASIVTPSLTTVRVDTERMGKLACEMLDKLIRHVPIEETAVMLEPQLVIRESTRRLQ